MSCYSIDGRYTNNEDFNPSLVDFGFVTQSSPRNSNAPRPRFTFATPMECTKLQQHKVDLCDYLAHPSVKVPNSLVRTVETICNNSLEKQKGELCNYLNSRSVKVPDSLKPTIQAICNKGTEYFQTDDDESPAPTPKKVVSEVEKLRQRNTELETQMKMNNDFNRIACSFMSGNKSSEYMKKMNPADRRNAIMSCPNYNLQ